VNILLDTHVFLWWDSDPAKLPAGLVELLTDSENQLFLSVASAWEIQIKKQLGKLTLTVGLDELVESQQQINGLQLISVELRHVLALESLPAHHKDPFDRLLIAQARAEGLSIASVDPVFSKYDVKVIWNKD
jgi:PIN domain nuclease of toxin-antitoxin system